MQSRYIKNLLLILILSSLRLRAQEHADSIPENKMGEVVIKAFEQNRRLKEVPAAVNFIGRDVLGRFGSASAVQAVNTTPGVRMEERSPGSYRFSIRGSSLRSPFGVRNVKVYFNDLPITDPGGQTYLNQLGNYNLGTIEIIKGPGSSLYGAGTGGVLLIESLGGQEQAGVATEASAGSYGYRNLYASITTGTEKNVSRASFQHQESSGYRDHSALQKDVHSWTGTFQVQEHRVLQASFLYGDLFYETPGALTQAEYDANPRAARPSVGSQPGSDAANASIHQRQFLAGISYTQPVAPGWTNKSVLYGMFTELRNPSLRNYTRSAEPHVGGRTLFHFNHSFQRSVFHFDLGAEWQQGFGSVTTHKNLAGTPDSLQGYDEINNRLQFLFGQASLDWLGWTVTGGASIDQLRLKFQRFTPANLGIQRRRFSNQVAPRIALLKKLGAVHVYTSFSRGFSPPSTAELLPTGGAVNLGLNAEDGKNYELGLRGDLFRRVSVDINAFFFTLSNTIVQRRDASGGDYYLNSGKTKQYGVETYIAYTPFTRSFFQRDLFWISHTWHHFYYRSFRQLNNDFSGRQMPGDAAHALSTGFDCLLKKGWLGTVSYYFSSAIPLDDANTAYARPYHLLDARIGYQQVFSKKWQLRLAAGAANLLDQAYSLGNDINGFGGRYYNAAPRRNYYLSLMLGWLSKKS